MTSTAASPAIAVAAPTATFTSGAAASAPITPASAGDFLLMLGQLIGAGAPQPTIVGGAIKQEESMDADLAAVLDEASDAALLNAAGLTAPVVPPAPIAVALAPPATDAIEGEGVDLESIVAELKFARESTASAAGPHIFIGGEVIEELDAAPTSVIDAQRTAPEPVHMTAAPAESAPARATAHDAAISRPIHTPVGNQQWADEIGARLTMMAEAGKQTASLRLTPEHLGPLEIRIAINDDQASVWFGAAHAETRAAIEHALPRLRELFEASGMSLADAGVHHGTPKGQGERENAGSSHQSEIAAEESKSSVAVAVKLGLVDAYA